MRAFLVFIVVFVGVVCAVPWTKDRKDLPPGPWVRGCGECIIMDNIFRCQDCQDGMRFLTCSEIEYALCKSIMNNDGALDCTHSMLANGNELGEIPKGSYLEDCGGCLIMPSEEEDGSLVLECTECPDDNGIFHIAQMPYDPKNPCPEVLNKDGKLFCSTTYKEGIEDDVPRGEYDYRTVYDAPIDVESVEAELQKRMEERMATAS